MKVDYLTSAIKQFEYYKMLGEKTIEQLPADKLFWQYNEESNSVAIIVNHLWGNMRSRWTDFLVSDGEKSWRNRDLEFENTIQTKEELLGKWNEGWSCLFSSIKPLTDADFSKIIFIRNQGHTVVEAINRQLAHYSYHVGQLVFIGKMCSGESWKSLSIPKGYSNKYNEEKFAKEKNKEHFTDQFLMNEILADLEMAHNDFWIGAKKRSILKVNTPINGKWSVVQNVDHINTILFAMNKYLSTPKEKLAAKFGLIDRGALTKYELNEKYSSALKNRAISVNPFISENHTNKSITELIQLGQVGLKDLLAQLKLWTLAETEKQVCPHPLLGNLSLKEMLFFLAFHVRHHQQSISKIQ